MHVRSMPAFFALVSLRFLLQITKVKSVAGDHFSSLERNLPRKHRPVIHERVKFAVFAARIHIARQVPEERRVDFPAGKFGAEFFRIDAYCDAAKSSLAELAREFSRIPLPDWEYGGHSFSREIPFTILAQILQKDIAKRHPAHTVPFVREQSVTHRPFVNRIDALRGDTYLLQRQPEALRLS